MAPKTKNLQAAKKKSTPSRNPVTPISPIPLPAQRGPRFYVLQTRDFFPNRYVSDSAIDALEIRESCDKYFASMNWKKFVSMHPFQFEPIVLEFLSSLFVEREQETHNCSLLRFRLLGKEYDLSINQLNDIFGFWKHGYKTLPEGWNGIEQWKQLTVDGTPSYDPSISKATKFKDPALRYIHRFLASTTYGRQTSNGVVNLHELFFLWCMVEDKKISTGYFLAEHLEYVATKKTGRMCVGLFVSVILQSLDPKFDPEKSTMKRIEGDMFLDIKTLLSMRMLKKEHGHYVLRKAVAVSDDEDDRVGPSSKRARVDDASVPSVRDSSATVMEGPQVPSSLDVMAKLYALERKIDTSHASLQSNIDQNHSEVLRQIEQLQLAFTKFFSLQHDGASTSQLP